METIITIALFFLLIAAAIWIIKWVLSLGRISGLLLVIAILLVVIIVKLSELGA